ncbi:MAG TPA: PKD domain-containing protein [Candidatus Dormibacteraeota bacterium]|nr:PKD domain-containing protein [Candidatus Dormibacteraeota bacterium]
MKAGRPRGEVPKLHPGALPPSRQSVAGTNPSCTQCNPPLVFTPGVPVIGSNAGTPGEVTITPFYWAAPGYSFPITYKSIIAGYLANVALDSQKNTNAFSVATQYYQEETAGSTPQHIRYQVAVGSEVDDGSAYPAAGCTSATGFTACVDDAALQSELTAKLDAAHLPIDESHLYLALFPSAVETCEPPDSKNVTRCSANDYCAYHSSSATAPYLIYANEPMPDPRACSDPYNGPQAPNGDAAADSEVSLISHEANEAITDWAGAWIDSAGFENGDECDYVYGTPQGRAGAYFNQTIGNGHYYTQEEFSNEDYALGNGDLTTSGGGQVKGCVGQEDLPVASVKWPANANAGNTLAFDASASSDADNTSLSFVWSWGDGSPTAQGVTATHVYCPAGDYKVTVTVTDGDGWQSSATATVAVAQGPPVVDSVSPGSGLTGGGTKVTISGCALTGATGVAFGTVSATQFSQVSDQVVDAIAPTHGQGVVDVTVTTPLGSSTASTADHYSYLFSGLYTLDGYGGMHGNDSSPVATTAYWGGWNIARVAKAWPGGGAQQSGFVLDGYGGLHPYGAAGLGETPATARTHYWGFDIARDFAFLPDGTGGFVLDGYGGLHGFRVNGGTAALQAVGGPYWGGWDIARKVVIWPDGTGGYVLDGYGGIHAFGINGPVPTPDNQLVTTGYWSWNIARDIALVPGDKGHAGYVLDGYGGAHPFHPASDGSVMPTALNGVSYWGWDIARGIWLLPGSGTAGYTLDGYGGIHAFGGAPAIVNHPYWPGWDIAKTISGM